MWNNITQHQTVCPCSHTLCFYTNLFHVEMLGPTQSSSLRKMWDIHIKSTSPCVQVLQCHQEFNSILPVCGVCNFWSQNMKDSPQAIVKPVVMLPVIIPKSIWRSWNAQVPIFFHPCILNPWESVWLFSFGTLLRLAISFGVLQVTQIILRAGLTVLLLFLPTRKALYIRALTMNNHRITD